MAKNDHQDELPDFVYSLLRCTSCSLCGGFYGSNHGEPLCPTCHLFLYDTEEAEAITVAHDALAPMPQRPTQDMVAAPAHSDSSDSGNDEDIVEPFPVLLVEPAPVQAAVEEDAESIGESMGEASDVGGGGEEGGDGDQEADPPADHDEPGPSHRHPVPTPRRLAQQLHDLTVPRAPDHRDLDERALEAIPNELFTRVFHYLDDLTLWCCSQVCRRWHKLVHEMTADDDWRNWLHRRWPLYRRGVPQPCVGQGEEPRPSAVLSPLRLLHPCPDPATSFHLYSRLVHAAPCLRCLMQVRLAPNSAELLARLPDAVPEAEHPVPPASSSNDDLQVVAWWYRRLMVEWRSLQNDSVDGVEARPLDARYTQWIACIGGPEGSPYAGGRFFLLVTIPLLHYPMRPPLVRFITRIFHPNVSRHGDIGLDVLAHNWSLALTLSKVLLSIQSLLTDPIIQPVCMEPDIGRLLADDAPKYERIARLFTKRFAML